MENYSIRDLLFLQIFQYTIGCQHHAELARVEVQTALHPHRVRLSQRRVGGKKLCVDVLAAVIGVHTDTPLRFLYFTPVRTVMARVSFEKETLCFYTAIGI